MKKLALLLLGILLGFLLCYFFFGKEDMVDDEIVDPKPPRTGLINSGTMRAMNQAYNTRADLINKGLGIIDNRSSWYSLEDLRTYLIYAEFQAKGTKTPMDGVRLYVGVNDLSANNGNGNTTLFFAPTSSAITAKSLGSIINLSLSARAGGGDIPGGEGLDLGGVGYPPGSGYPNPPGNN